MTQKQKKGDKTPQAILAPRKVTQKRSRLYTWDVFSIFQNQHSSSESNEIKQKESFFKNRKGMIFLYVLFSVSLFMIIFTSLIFIINKQTSFVMASAVVNRLESEGESSAEKILGLYQVNPQSSLLFEEVNDSNNKKVTLSSYDTRLEGYVYQGKTDLIVLDSKNYIAGHKMPDKITITNDSNQDKLVVIVRLINRNNNIILASQSNEIDHDNNNVEIDLLGFASGITEADAIETFFEIALSSDSSKGDLYSINTDTDFILLADDFRADIQMYEFSLDTDIGSMQQGISSTLHAAASYNLFSKNDFGINPYISSSNVPGISPAYIDTFTLDSSNDWTCSGEGCDNSSFPLKLSPNSRYTLKNTIEGNFDMRVEVEKPSDFVGQSGIFVTIGGNEYYLGIKKDTSVCQKENEEDNTCSSYSPDKEAYVFYKKDDTLKFCDIQSNCTNSTADWKEFIVDTNADSFMLRLVRRDGKVEASVCRDGTSCDTSDTPWFFITENLINIGDSEVDVGLYTKDGQSAEYPYFRVVRLEDIVYKKTIPLGSEMEIKEIRVNGHIPTSSSFSLRVDYEKADELYVGNTYNDLIFQPLPNELDNSSGNVLRADTLHLILTLVTPSGELSEIPFIRGIQIPNVEIPPSCISQCGEEGAERQCGSDGCGGVCGTCSENQLCSTGVCSDAQSCNVLCSDLASITLPANSTSVETSCSTSALQTECGNDFVITDFTCNEGYYKSVDGTSCLAAQCMINSDCGEDGWIGTSVCQGNNVYQTYETWLCSGGGTKDAHCTSAPETRLKEECSGICENGSCTDDTTPPVLDGITANPVWETNGSSTYKITVKATDVGSGVQDVRALIFQGKAWDSSARGYFGWRTNMYHWTNTDQVACSGGGFASKDPSGYGQEYIELVGCSTSLDDNHQRSVTFTVKPTADFGVLPDMDIGGYAKDHALNSSGWKYFYDLFSSVAVVKECSGTVPTGNNIFKGPTSYAYTLGGNQTTSWTYNANATNSTSCLWKCISGYKLSGSVCILDDIDPPQCTVSNVPTDWTNQSITVTATCTDGTGSGCTSHTQSHTFNANGSKTFTFKDNRGNSGTCTAEIDKIDKTPPTCGSWSPSSPSWIKGTQTFTLSGSTDNSQSMRNAGGNCSVATNGEDCNYQIEDQAGNTETCASPTAQIVPSNTTLYATYNSGISKADYAEGYKTPSQVGTVSNKWLTSAAKYFYDSNININRGHIQMKVDSSQLAGGTHTLFEWKKDSSNYMVVYSELGKVYFMIRSSSESFYTSIDSPSSGEVQFGWQAGSMYIGNSSKSSVILPSLGSTHFQVGGVSTIYPYGSHIRVDWMQVFDTYN